VPKFLTSVSKETNSSNRVLELCGINRSRASKSRKVSFCNTPFFYLDVFKRSRLDLRSCLPHIHQREQLRRPLLPPRVSVPPCLLSGENSNSRCFRTWKNSSDPLSSQTLAKDDVVKIHIGAHIDGFAAVTAETIVVSATPENPVTGRRADVLKAAHTAAEVAMRLVKVGNKNWAITDAVNKVAAAWGCKPVEGGSCGGHRFSFVCLSPIP